MKYQRLPKNLMILVSTILLILTVTFDVLTYSAGETNSDLLRSFLGLITLLVCAGAVSFYILGREKPLDWIIGGAAIGTGICLCGLLGLIDNDFAAGVFFWLYLLEFLLSAGNKIGRHFGLFI